MSTISGILSGIRSGIRSGVNPPIGGALTWTLTRTSGGPAWDAGAFSSAGFSGDGRIECTLDVSRDYMLGLSLDNPDADYATIDFAVYLGGSDDLVVFEDGVSVHSEAAGYLTGAEGSVFAVRRTGTTITVEKDGVVIYTSAASSSGTLYGDCSIYNAGTAITTTRMYSGAAGLVTQWIDLVLVSAT